MLIVLISGWWDYGRLHFLNIVLSLRELFNPCRSKCLWGASEEAQDLEELSNLTKAHGWWVGRPGFQARAWPLFFPWPPSHPIRGDLCERASPGLPPHTRGPASFETCLWHQRALTESHIGGASAEVMLSIKLLGKNSQYYDKRRKWKNDLRESGLKGKAI